ncbi:MAG TPA: exodeoxyribonuclease VII large subunit [Acidimicrobiales bacterium]
MAGEERTWSVSELSDGIAVALRKSFPDEVWVRGEIQGWKAGRAGHAYFQLTDHEEGDDRPTACLSVALFANARQRVVAMLRRAGGVRLADGIEVRIRGRLAYYGPQGRLQLLMSAIDPEHTLGRMAADRDRLLRALRAEGLVDAQAGLRMPVAPLHVALVTAASSAAASDFLHELAGSGLAFRVRVLDTRVQGPGAEQRVALALRRAAALRPDVVALVRGGGARSDLATFDAEVVARTVCGLGVPVVTGIGHEVDWSVADEVAHVAFKTPTACAAGLVAEVRSFTERLARAWERLAGRAGHRLDAADRALAGTAAAVGRATRGSLAVAWRGTDEAARRLEREATLAVDRSAARLAVHGGRLEGATRAHLRAADRSLAGATARLSTRTRRALAAADSVVRVAETRATALDPAKALARGWSITRDADGRVVRSVAALAPGDRLVTTFADGSAASRVEEVPG